MAGGILAILDDVAMLLDDTAAMSKVAAKKTAALLGDDLAVNAEKATGFNASRELPVIWAISKGALLNKVIILPFAFLLSAFMPWLIVPILLLGGAYLSYEGAEKVYEWMSRKKPEQPAATESSDKETILTSESTKIKSAIRTDFILSIEIVVISLDSVFEQSFMMQVVVVSLIALAAVIAVYGVVALLVRMDDVGLLLIERGVKLQGFFSKASMATGKLLINSLPKVIHLLGIIGTIAMLLVGGGMFVHNIDALHHLLASVPSLVAELIVGLTLGLVLFGLLSLFGVKKH